LGLDFIKSKNLDNVTAVTVVYKTIDYVTEVYKTFRSFYPTLRYILVDNSGGDECTRMMREWTKTDPNLTLIELSENVGHGYGMQVGINHSKTDFLFIFDTDIIFKEGGFIEKALGLFEEDTYGVGWIIDISWPDGKAINTKYTGEILHYLFDGFWFTNKHVYAKFHKLHKYGLPLFQAMRDIHEEGLSQRILKPLFTGNRDRYLYHYSGGTRKIYGDVEDVVPGWGKRHKGDMTSGLD